MRPQIPPQLNQWYALPDFDVFRVTEIGEDYIQIQYSDGALETVDQAIWYDLKAVKTQPTEDWLEAQEEQLKEMDFLTLGVAPGTEGVDYGELYAQLEGII